MSLFCLRLGEKALNSWLCLVAIAMNLFVIKQINVCTLEVTSTDALTIGYFLGLSLIQEYFGVQAARRHVFLSFACSLGFVLLSLVQLLYKPNHLDMSHHQFVCILTPMPRIFFASIVSFLLMQLLDISIFQRIRKKWSGKWFTGRVGICLVISQVLDTIIFSYLGLYKLIPNLFDVMMFSLIIKLFVIIASLPFANLSHKIGKRRAARGGDYGNTEWTPI